MNGVTENLDATDTFSMAWALALIVKRQK